MMMIVAICLLATISVTIANPENVIGEDQRSLGIAQSIRETENNLKHGLSLSPLRSLKGQTSQQQQEEQEGGGLLLDQLYPRMLPVEKEIGCLPEQNNEDYEEKMEELPVKIGQESKYYYNQCKREHRFVLQLSDDANTQHYYIDVFLDLVDPEHSVQLSAYDQQASSLLDIDEEGLEMKRPTQQVSFEVNKAAATAAQQQSQTYVIVVKSLRPSPFRYALRVSTHREFSCRNACSSNGLCDKEQKKCLCRYPFIGESCDVKTIALRTTYRQLISLQPNDSAIVRFSPEDSTEAIEKVEFIIVSQTPIIDLIAEISLSQGLDFPTESKQLERFTQQIHSDERFSFFVGKNYLVDEFINPIAVNIKIKSLADSSYTFTIEAKPTYESLLSDDQQLYFMIGATAILVACVFYGLAKICHFKQQQNDLLSKAQKLNEDRCFDEELPCQLANNKQKLQQQSSSVAPLNSNENNKLKNSKTDLLNKIIIKRELIQTSKRKIQLESVTTLNKQVIDMYMPVQLYSAAINPHLSTKESTQTGSQKIIDSPKTPLGDPYEQEQVDCPICRQALKMLDNVRVTVCKHVAHDECLVFWLKRNESCPMCTRSLSKINLFGYNSASNKQQELQNEVREQGCCNGQLYEIK